MSDDEPAQYGLVDCERCLYRAVTGLAFLAVYVAACQVCSRVTGRRIA